MKKKLAQTYRLPLFGNSAYCMKLCIRFLCVVALFIYFFNSMRLVTLPTPVLGRAVQCLSWGELFNVMVLAYNGPDCRHERSAHPPCTKKGGPSK